MQYGKGAAVIRDINVLMETLPFSPSELAATHSPPEMYSGFLVTIYSPTRRVLSLMPSECADMDFMY